MLRLFVLVLAVVLGAAPAGAAEPAHPQAARFVPGTEDVPLMAGLVPLRDAGVVFDKPQGRIVEASAKGRLSRKAVRSFYAASLPQLGWTAAGTGRFVREGERLTLDFSGRDGNLTVGFTLEPL